MFAPDESSVPFQRFTMSVDGFDRVYWAYLPPSGVPLTDALIGCHGAHNSGYSFGGKPERRWWLLALQGVACLFPNSLREMWSLEGPDYQKDRRFLHQLRLRAIDQGAGGVGLTGNSSGGYMTLKLRHTDPISPQVPFSFYAPSAANLPYGWVPGLLPAPTFLAHGTNDSKVPFKGTVDQWGWEDALRIFGEVNNGGVAPTPPVNKPTKLSCFGFTTTLVDFATTTAATGGARVNGGHHAWHACPDWQMQQAIADWARQHGYFSPVT